MNHLNWGGLAGDLSALGLHNAAQDALKYGQQATQSPAYGIGVGAAAPMMQTEALVAALQHLFGKQESARAEDTSLPQGFVPYDGSDEISPGPWTLVTDQTGGLGNTTLRLDLQADGRFAGRSIAAGGPLMGFAQQILGGLQLGGLGQQFLEAMQNFTYTGAWLFDADTHRLELGFAISVGGMGSQRDLWHIHLLGRNPVCIFGRDQRGATYYFSPILA